MPGKKDRTLAARLQWIEKLRGSDAVLTREAQKLRVDMQLVNSPVRRSILRRQAKVESAVGC